MPRSQKCSAFCSNRAIPGSSGLELVPKGQSGKQIAPADWYGMLSWVGMMCGHQIEDYTLILGDSHSCHRQEVYGSGLPMVGHLLFKWSYLFQSVHSLWLILILTTTFPLTTQELGPPWGSWDFSCFWLMWCHQALLGWLKSCWMESYPLSKWGCSMGMLYPQTTGLSCCWGIYVKGGLCG